MESVLAAVIGAVATITVAVLKLRSTQRRNQASAARQASIAAVGSRLVFYRGDEHRFLNFGGRNCRIEPLAGGPSFLAPTHELFHDRDGRARITRDTIVARP